MPSSSICWGIEIGAGAIKAIKLEAGDAGSVRVLEFLTVPHKKVLSTPDLDQNDAMRVALAALASQVDLSGTSIAVSVPGHSAFARFAKLPPVDPKKVPDIVKFEAVQQIPFPIDQVEWDYQTFASPDSPEIEVGIFAITRERITEKLTLYEDVGIVPDCVTLSPVAAYNALAYDLQFTEKTPGTIILDIGTTSTDLIVAEAGRVWIRTFPIGGHHFTEALVAAFSITYPKAELKREAENTKHARQIFQAMRSVFGDLAQDVQRSIGYYTSLHKDAKLERLIGLGSTFRLPGLRKYLKQQLQMDVYRMEQFKRISVDGPKAGEFQSTTLNMATAYGLALQGLGMAALEANLMPTGVVREAMWKRKIKWFGVAAAVAVAAGAAMCIRPFLDSQAVANEPPAKVIAEVIRDGNALKKDAMELTSTTVSNTAASDVMALMEGREYYARIMDDVDQMLQSAQEKAGPEATKVWPAYTVKAFSGDYAAPGSEPGAAQPADPSAAQGRIHISLKLETQLPDAQRFTISTIDEWLRHNAKRPGVPYELVVGSNPSRKVDERTSAGPVEANPAGGDAGGTRQPEARAGRGQPGKLIIVGGAGETSGYGGPSTGQPAETLTKNEAEALDSVRKLAPAPTEPALPAGTKTTTFEVTWDAVILPKDAKPAGGGT